MTRPSFTPSCWEDLRVPLETTKVGASQPPDYGTFQGDLKAYLFDPARDEDVLFSVQMPHGWQWGSAIKPHVHLGFPAAPVNGKTIRIVLQYSVQSPNGGAFPVQQQCLGTYTIDTGKASDVQYGHVLLALSPDITMTGHTASAMILCRLFRDVSEDDYAADVAILEFDLHYQIDSLGTVAEATRKP